MTSFNEIDQLLQKATTAFHEYKRYPLRRRADFMRCIAQEIEALGDALLETAAAETHLPLARLSGERGRTLFQLRSYAEAAEAGHWLDARIDTADNERLPAKPDTRKTNVPLGPVVVFGASNFPFAYSTAGGDTASALAAGCPVLVKAHPAHPKTSALVASAIFKAAQACEMPEGVFAHVEGEGFETGIYLAKHPLVKAIGFTGSFSGGKALFDAANQRQVPIPVFAEMGSVNPVFILANKLATETQVLAQQLVGSVTLGMGQFCTNPGLIVAVEGTALKAFLEALKVEIAAVKPQIMLHQGIADNYAHKRTAALEQADVRLVAISDEVANAHSGQPSIATVAASTFLANPLLHQEVFGPYSLIIQCKNDAEMLAVAQAMEGQLTSTLMATDSDLEQYADMLPLLQEICGRLIFNNVPTGVEVSFSMQHGGPFPATTDSRFTSVGADAIKRFVRPLCYQNCPDKWLPEELKNANPLGVYRIVNNVLTNKAC